MSIKAKRMGKYRPRRGDTHPNAKLTRREVLLIRELYRGNWSPAGIADAFGISVTHVYDLGKGNRWEWLKSESVTRFHAKRFAEGR